MNIKELIEFIALLQKLDRKKQAEIYYMIKGAALVAEKAPPVVVR